ncbi:hypothetical protein Barb4_01619 [Bacteroidales bacterium Barb4]|nr:hypothetical protein Barb4_01619 [Bacteroidales bacterium Barb4]
MKKNLVYLLSLLCTVVLFTACGSDDDSANESWKKLSGTYEGDALNLNLNGIPAVLISTGKSASVVTASAEAATVTLTNVVPEAVSLVVPVTLGRTPTGGYTLSGSKTESNCLITLSGTFMKDGQLELYVTRKFEAFPLTGTWKLALPSQAVYLKAAFGDPAIDAQLSYIAPMLNGLIVGKVSAVNVFLEEHGTFNVNWQNQGETTPTVMPEAIAAMVQLQYASIDGQLMIAIDKNVLAMMQDLLAATLAKIGLDIERVISLLEKNDLGGYYGFPFKVKQDGNSATFYLEKESTLALLDALPSDIKASLPVQFAPLLPMLQYAQVLEFGLTFSK